MIKHAIAVFSWHKDNSQNGNCLRRFKALITYLIKAVISERRQNASRHATFATLHETLDKVTFDPRCARETIHEKVPHEVGHPTSTRHSARRGCDPQFGRRGLGRGTPRSSAVRSATIRFSGDVTAYTAATSSTAGSITLTDRAGATLTFSTSSTTTVTEIGGSGSTLQVNDFATVQATVSAPTVATAITFSAAAPVSFSGVVTAYTAPSGSTNGSITLLKRNLASLTYAVTSSTVMSENGGGTATIAVDDFATIQAAADMPNVALTIDFDVAAPVRFTGRVTAYTAATGTTNGSLTVKDGAGASLTYTTLLTTTITEKGGSGDSLEVGDQATVVAAASAKTDALTVTFIPAPPVRFYGQVSCVHRSRGFDQRLDHPRQAEWQQRHLLGDVVHGHYRKGWQWRHARRW